MRYKRQVEYDLHRHMAFERCHNMCYVNIFLKLYIKTMTYAYDILIYRYDDGTSQLRNMMNKDFNLYNMPRFDIRGSKIDEKGT